MTAQIKHLITLVGQFGLEELFQLQASVIIGDGYIFGHGAFLLWWLMKYSGSVGTAYMV
jgi:hypothetical protein